MSVALTGKGADDGGEQELMEIEVPEALGGEDSAPPPEEPYVVGSPYATNECLNISFFATSEEKKGFFKSMMSSGGKEGPTDEETHEEGMKVFGKFTGVDAVRWQFFFGRIHCVCVGVGGGISGLVGGLGDMPFIGRSAQPCSKSDQN